MNNLSTYLQDIRKEFVKHVDVRYRDGAIKYFKEPIVCYGVRSPIVKKIAVDYFKKIKHLDKKEILALCEELLKNKYNEEASIAVYWASKLKKQYEPADFALFESWLSKYIDNWGKDDDFCMHVINPFIQIYPDAKKKVISWAYSKNRWMRRAAAVSFIESSYSAPANIDEIFNVATILLQDEDDLVQKGYGWMLKAASFRHQKEVFDFLMKHKAKMPRTALRYAIEKMPESLSKQVLAKSIK